MTLVELLRWMSALNERRRCHVCGKFGTIGQRLSAMPGRRGAKQKGGEEGTGGNEERNATAREATAGVRCWKCGQYGHVFTECKKSAHVLWFGRRRTRGVGGDWDEGSLNQEHALSQEAPRPEDSANGLWVASLEAHWRLHRSC